MSRHKSLRYNTPPRSLSTHIFNALYTKTHILLHNIAHIKIEYMPIASMIHAYVMTELTLFVIRLDGYWPRYVALSVAEKLFCSMTTQL